MAFLETNPCPTLYPTYLPLFPETINWSRYCTFPGSPRCTSPESLGMRLDLTGDGTYCKNIVSCYVPEQIAPSLHKVLYAGKLTLEFHSQCTRTLPVARNTLGEKAKQRFITLHNLPRNILVLQQDICDVTVPGDIFHQLLRMSCLAQSEVRSWCSPGSKHLRLPCYSSFLPFTLHCCKRVFAAK